MAKQTLTFGETDDVIKVGSVLWDESDDVDIFANGGYDTIEAYVDGLLRVYGGAGDEYMDIGGSGTGFIYGGAGDDEIWHRSNEFFTSTLSIYGGDGNDTIHGGYDVADSLYGGNGDDQIELTKGNIAYGGAGNDMYFVRGGSIVESAGGGYDSASQSGTYTMALNVERYTTVGESDVTGNYQNNLVEDRGIQASRFRMGDGADTVAAAWGNDSMSGEAGTDFLLGGADHDLIYGGDGNDHLKGDGSTDDGRVLSDGTFWVNNLVGNDTIYGDAGNDIMEGGLGTDVLYGGTGNDNLNGGWSAWGLDTMAGGTGDDTYLAIDQVGVIVEAMSEGTDTVITRKFNITLAANVENLRILNQTDAFGVGIRVDGTGNLQSNTITGSDGVNLLNGMAGNDTIYGAGGNDSVNGGTGNDLVKGDLGNDTVNGDDGDDFAYGGEGNDFVRGGLGNDELGGNGGNDTLYGDQGNDTAYAADGNDYVNGGDGYDRVFGEAGNDVLRGGVNTDTVYGGDGDDYIYGDGANDFLYGGAGSDRFIFLTAADSAIGTGIDRIQDFALGADKINVSTIDANTALAGNDAFVWAGMSLPEVAKAGNLWGQNFAATTYSGAFVRVYGDVNGDNVADFSIDVMAVAGLDASAFIL